MQCRTLTEQCSAVRNSAYFILPIKLKSLRSCTKSWWGSSFSSYLAVPVKFKVWRKESRDMGSRGREEWWEEEGRMSYRKRCWERMDVRRGENEGDPGRDVREGGEKMRRNKGHGWRWSTRTYLRYNLRRWRRFHSSFSYSHGWGVMSIEEKCLPQNALEFWIAEVRINDFKEFTCRYG